MLKLNRHIFSGTAWLIIILCLSCTSDTQKREDYKLTLIDFEEITLNPDSLFTTIQFDYFVLYDFIDGLADGGPFAVSDVEVAWISNFYYLSNATGNYLKCDIIRHGYSSCTNMDGVVFAVDLMSTPGENDIYSNQLKLSNQMIGDTLILHYTIYKNGDPLDYYYKDPSRDLIIIPIN